MLVGNDANMDATFWRSRFLHRVLTQDKVFLDLAAKLAHFPGSQLLATFLERNLHNEVKIMAAVCTNLGHQMHW